MSIVDELKKKQTKRKFGELFYYLLKSVNAQNYYPEIGKYSRQSPKLNPLFWFGLIFILFKTAQSLYNYVRLFIKKVLDKI